MWLECLCVMMCLNPVCGWLLKIFEAQDGSISTVTLIDGDGGPPIPNRTRCVQVSLPDNSNAPKSYGSCSTLWDWSNCSIDFEASSSMSSEYCSPALKEIRCRQQNGFFNFCGRKVCTDPRDGSWGSWSPEVCNVQTCGSGQVVRTRKCDNPVQQIGGLPCLSSNSDTETETIKACDIDCKGNRHAE
ncbi:coadhesin-like [Tigriopus californicus]|uniref:coadhesin-like n=1 Tax=Tigriopus californicus TaxID=6832 RepID=UPI0027DA5C95|nr:coadhesin-like [Tigriopus californicus]